LQIFDITVVLKL